MRGTVHRPAVAESPEVIVSELAIGPTVVSFWQTMCAATHSLKVPCNGAALMTMHGIVGIQQLP
jgi:hypothetical protein